MTLPKISPSPLIPLPSSTTPQSYPWQWESLGVQLPLSSGVYWFKDSIGSILYVGKAKNLKRRLASYHRAHDPKTVTLVKHIHTINFLITDSELDALLLEAAYIKAFQPPYNISLKDDKSPIYIAITQETYPKVLILRKPQLHGRYFGP